MSDQFKAEVEALKPFDVTDAEGWQTCVRNNSEDAYSFAVVQYAATWANLMEQRMAEGATLSDIAKRTSHEADTDGITGFMYGAAVSILANCWRHGEQLRRWHNIDTQVRDEGVRANETGGVLNPAVMVLGSDPA